MAARWEDVSDRTGEIVPSYGFTQAEREIASAGHGEQVLAIAR